MFVIFKNSIAEVNNIKIVDHANIDEDFNINGTYENIYFGKNNAVFKILIKRDKEGVVFQYDLDLKLPRMQSALKIAETNTYKRFVFFVTDNNGTKYVIGRKNKGYRLQHNGIIDEIENAIMLKVSSKSSLDFEITEDLENINYDDFVITNTIIQSCSTTEVIAENISVAEIINESIITHNIGSTEVAVSFFENGTIKKDIDYEVIDGNTIKLYLPFLDYDNVNVFTGDVYIEKRALNI